MIVETTNVLEDPARPRTTVEQALARIWSDVLGVTGIGADDDFFSLGGDSLLSIQVVSKAQSRGIPLDYRMIFRSPTLRQLAASVEARYSPISSAAVDVAAAAAAASSDTPLTPIQQRFFETAGSHVNHWNQWVLLDLESPLRLQDLSRAVEQLRAVHDVLRTEFHEVEGEWKQRYGTQSAKAPVTWIDLAACPPADRGDAIDAVIEETNQALSLKDGDLIRFVCLDLGSSAAHKLLIVAHHVIMDNVSFHILVNDLDTCLDQCASGAEPRLERNTCTYKAWAEALTRSAQQGRFESEADYWLEHMRPASDAETIPCDLQADPAENTYASMRSCEISFSEQQTLAIINKLPALLHCHVNTVLLDALVGALGDALGVDEAIIDIESHGRQWSDDAVDLRKTTGWYTSIFPQRFSHGAGGSGSGSVYGRLRAMDAQLEAVANCGVGYGVLRYLSSGGASGMMRQRPDAQICFNYLGQVGRGAKGLSAFSTAHMRVGASHANELRRAHLLLVQSAVHEGRLVVHCYYSTRFHREDTIKRLLGRMQQNLSGLLPSVADGFRRSFRQLALEGSDASETLDVLQQIAVCYPLLGIQTSILFQHLSSQGGAPPYVVQVSCTLRGNLAPAAFEKAWQTIVARHESLRTSFHWAGLDAPVQAVHRSGRVSMKIQDWRQKGAAAQDADLQRVLRKDRLAGISLDGAEPLMRLTIVRLADDRWFCIWTHHHIQLDGWSQVIVLRELFEVYRAILAGEQAALAPPPSLGDYFRSLDRFPATGAGRYWRQYLQGFCEPTPILTNPGGDDGSERYRDLAIRIGMAESDEIHRFAKAHSLTLHTIFSALWGVWLSIHGERDDVVFGNVVSGRSADMESVERLVGTFINTIPVRMILDEGHDVLSWLKRVQEEQAASHRYELYPLADVVKHAETARGRLLFDSILVFENLPGGYESSIAESGLRLESIDFSIRENYPVVISIKPERPVMARINYREDLVDPRIRHAETFFMIALAALTRNSDQPLLLFRGTVKEKYFERLSDNR